MTPQSHEFIFAYCTFPDAEVARKISLALVEEKLIACANLLPGMQSVYPWQGKIEAGFEVAGILKTRAELWEPLAKRFSELHPYEVPCLVEIPLERGLAPYLNWIRSETLSAPEKA